MAETNIRTVPEMVNFLAEELETGGAADQLEGEAVECRGHKIVISLKNGSRFEIAISKLR